MSDSAWSRLRKGRVGQIVAVYLGVSWLMLQIVGELRDALELPAWVGPTALIGSAAARLVMTGPGPALKFIGTHEGTAAPASVKDNVWQNQRMPTVDGIEIVGAHPEADGIEAVGTMKLIVTRVEVRKARHAVHLTTRNRNVIVSNCHFYENF